MSWLTTLTNESPRLLTTLNDAMNYPTASSGVSKGIAQLIITSPQGAGNSTHREVNTRPILN